MALSIRNSLHGTINKYKILVLQDTIDISGTLLPSGTIIVMGGTGTAKLAYTVNGGTSWTAVSLFSTSGQAIAYGLQRLVAVGQGGNTLITSANGTTWTTVVSPFSTIGYDVMCDGSKWIGVGQGGATLAYSGTGGSWTSVSGIFTTAGYGLLYDSANQLYFAAGEGGNTLATSSDGVIWTGSSPLTTRAYGVGGPATYSGDTSANALFYVIGGNGTSNTKYSLGGYYLQSAANQIYSSYCYDVKYANGLYVSVGRGGNSNGYSSDGINWTGGTGPFGTGTASGYGVNYGNGIWIATGTKGSGLQNSIVRSTNGINWTASSNATSIFYKEVNAAYYGNGIWVAVGTVVYSNYYSIATSTDNGLTWTGRGGTSIIGTPLCVFYANGLWVVGGINTNTLVTSSDNGVTWIGRTTYTDSVNDVAYGNGMWVAISSYSTGNSIAYSSNGTSWTGISLSLGFSGINYNNGIWTATGTQMAYSNNGINWTLGPTTGFSIGKKLTSVIKSIIKPKYIAAGSGSILMGSTDGTTWYALPSPFTTAAKSIAWSATLSRWVAVGEGTNTIAWSDDGVNWTGLGTTYFATRGNKVKYDSATSKFYAVGEGTNLLVSSSDGKTWTAISTTGAVTTAGIGICLV